MLKEGTNTFQPLPKSIEKKKLQECIPPLENGDRLTRAEFERRYQAMPNIKKAELIEGVVYMPSPVHFEGHGEPHLGLAGWLALYCSATPGVRGGDNASVRLDLDNEPQPDLLLLVDAGEWRRSYVDENDYIRGAPELVIEIAGTSATHDLGKKLNIYRRNGVQEYIVWQVYDGQIKRLALSEEQYTPLTPDENGVIRSQVFPGLWLAVNAMLAGDLATVFTELQKGLQSPEHADFVARLAQQK